MTHREPDRWFDCPKPRGHERALFAIDVDADGLLSEADIRRRVTELGSTHVAAMNVSDAPDYDKTSTARPSAGQKGSMIPTTIHTRCGLTVRVEHTLGSLGGTHVGEFAKRVNEQAQLQAARIETFLKNDDHFYAGPETTTAAPKVPAGWHEVDSTNLRAVKWDPDRQSLTVEFVSNRSRYRYDHVNESLVRGLLDAPSIGSFFTKRIRGRYPSTKLGE